MSICPVVSGKQCLLEVIHKLWLLKSFCLPLLSRALNLEGRKYDIDIPFRSEHPKDFTLWISSSHIG